MKKKSIKVITVLLAMVMLFVSSSSVSAMSLQNTIAHRALKQQIIADKRQYCNFGMTTIKYVYADIDGDHVAELITEPGYGYLTQAIYDYQNGNVRRVATVGQGNFTKYYPKHKVIYVGTASPCLNAIVESAFGSQPICITFRPFSASATATFDTVVDLPIPPFPYTAILIILFLLSCSHK